MDVKMQFTVSCRRTLAIRLNAPILSAFSIER